MRPCNRYVVDLGRGEYYVGSTRLSPAERFCKHKGGGRTAAGIVTRRGRRLRPDLSRLGKTEREISRELRRRGYRVYGSARAFRLER